MEQLVPHHDSLRGQRLSYAVSFVSFLTGQERHPPEAHASSMIGNGFFDSPSDLMVYDCHRQSFGFKIRCALQHAQNDMLGRYIVPGDCTPRVLPRAARSGRHVASLLAMTRKFGGAPPRSERYGRKRPRNDRGCMLHLTKSRNTCPLSIVNF